MSRRLTIERLDSRGLDFQNLDGMTAEEIEAFRQSYRTEDGNPQSGFDFLIDTNPAALKTYRYFATQIQPPYRNPRLAASGFGWLGFYGYLDFDEGVRYSVVPLVRAGITKAQIHEGMSIAFMVGGTRAMVTIGRALDGYRWPQVAGEREPWPEDWTSDPAALATGLDFTTTDVLPGEVAKILEWYDRTIGWVPGWVEYFGKYNPAALKGWRYRLEKALVTLPKQVLPLSFISAGTLFGNEDTIRENVLLARAFDTALDDVLQAIDLCAVYGTGKISTAYAAVGDVLDAWSPVPPREEPA